MSNNEGQPQTSPQLEMPELPKVELTLVQGTKPEDIFPVAEDPTVGPIADARKVMFDADGTLAQQPEVTINQDNGPRWLSRAATRVANLADRFNDYVSAKPTAREFAGNLVERGKLIARHIGGKAIEASQVVSSKTTEHKKTVVSRGESLVTSALISKDALMSNLLTRSQLAIDRKLALYQSRQSEPYQPKHVNNYQPKHLKQETKEKGPRFARSRQLGQLALSSVTETSTATRGKVQAKANQLRDDINGRRAAKHQEKADLHALRAIDLNAKLKANRRNKR